MTTEPATEPATYADSFTCTCRASNVALGIANPECPDHASTLSDEERAEGQQLVTAGLELVASATAGLGKALLHFPHDDAVAELHLLRELRAARIALAEMESMAETRAARLMTDDTLELPGLFAQRRGGASRKAWDNERMTGRVTAHGAQHVALDTTTGELDDDLAHRITEACELLWATARPAWRTGALKKAGIAFDDACETVYGRRSVQVSDAPLDVSDDE